LNLVRDLHDGFGGSLLSAIATLERSGASGEVAQTIATLKELRDDLRLVIDTTAHERGTDLLGLLTTLRHRWSQRLEAVGIDSRWQLDDTSGLQLGTALSLDLLRFLQEALTNVYKHAHATCAQVTVEKLGASLFVEVRDNGRGFDDQASAQGAGLISLRARAARLRARFTLCCQAGQGTTLSLTMPLSDEAPSDEIINGAMA
jgi:signal transduction histidine kinase